MKLIYFALSLFMISTFYCSSADNHHFHNNHVAMFSGVTTNLEHKSTDFSIGIDYEHRFSWLNGLLGIGIFGESVFAEHTEIIGGIPLFIHPWEGLKFLIAPGFVTYEYEKGEVSEHIIFKKRENILSVSGENEMERHNEFLMRIGVGYDFHAGAFSFSPIFNIDIINGHVALVYGFGIGIGF